MASPLYLAHYGPCRFRTPYRVCGVSDSRFWVLSCKRTQAETKYSCTISPEFTFLCLHHASAYPSTHCHSHLSCHYFLSPNSPKGGEVDPLQAQVPCFQPITDFRYSVLESSKAHWPIAPPTSTHISSLFCLGASSETTGSHSYWRSQWRCTEALVNDSQPMVGRS